MLHRNKIIQGISFITALLIIGLVFIYIRDSSSPIDPTISNIVEREPIVISSHALLEYESLDDLIKKSDLIVRGKISTIDPSRWNTNDGLLPDTVTVENISAELIIYTNMIFEPSAILKGNPSQDQIIVRTFGGNVGKDSMSYETLQLKLDQEYLLFLVKDTGSTGQLGPEHYIVFGAIQGVYEIKADRVIAQATLQGEQQRIASNSTQPRDDKGLFGVSIDDLMRQIDRKK